MATILIVDGPATGQWYCVPEHRPLVLSRDMEASTRSADPAIAAKHLEIRCDPRDGRYYAIDLDSAGNVACNGRPMPVLKPLNEGDRLEIGQSRLLFTRHDFISDAQVDAFIETRAARPIPSPDADPPTLPEPA